MQHMSKQYVLPARSVLAQAAVVLVFGIAAQVAQAAPASAPAAVPAETLAAAVRDRAWQAPLTSWGQPSLEGIWTTDDMGNVPQERPKEFGTRQSLTQKEFAKRIVDEAQRRNSAADPENFAGRPEIGTRLFGYTSLIVDPPNGQMPAMTAAALARRAPSDMGTFGPGPFNDFSDFTLYDRCITRGILGSTFPVGYGNGMRIVQTPDRIAISYEMVHDTRVIYLDGRPFESEAIRQYLGSSRGRWEGDTLVVETRNLTDKTSIGGYNGKGIRHSEKMVITERWRRVDPEMIEYRVTVDDPLTYTAPFTVRFMYTTQPNYRIYEYACHEGSRTVALSLGGEREYEKRAAAAAAAGEPIPERLPSEFCLMPLPKNEDEFIDINAGGDGATAR